MKRLLLLVAVTTGALALMFGHADAVVVTFFDDDSNLPSSFHVELSTPLPSGVSALVSTNATTETSTVILTGAFLGPNAPESDTLGLLELPGLTDVSDLIIVSKARSTTGIETGISIVFRSDVSEGSLGTCEGIRCQPEFNPGTTTPPNPFFNLTIFTTAGGTSAITGGLQINAFSDAETVPEPTTLLLLGSGLVGLGALRYTRTRGR